MKLIRKEHPIRIILCLVFSLFFLSMGLWSFTSEAYSRSFSTRFSYAKPSSLTHIYRDGINVLTPSNIRLNGFVKYDLARSNIRSNSFADFITWNRRGSSLTHIYRDIGRDIDHDGIPDRLDNCRLKHNPAQQDEDNDGLGDACDPDIDNDGLSNRQEANLGTDSHNPDTDGDGVLDGYDDCHSTPSGDTVDADGCSFYDYDGDGIEDIEDDCPYDAGEEHNNGCPDMTDTDGDGIPDYLDLCPHDVGPASEEGCPSDDECFLDPTDTDGDGVSDSCDLCPYDAGPEDEDGCP